MAIVTGPAAWAWNRVAGAVRCPCMDTTILDGGTGQELVKRAGEQSSPLWSAKVLADRPELVSAVHEDFLAAGADVITLACYTATPTRLERLGAGEEFARLQSGAIEAAHRARDGCGKSARIAGCLPPLVGDYRPEEALGEEAAFGEYQRVVAAQAEGVDLFLCETLPSIGEARIATRAAAKSGLPVWTSFTVSEQDGSHLRSGEDVAQAASAALEEGASAVLVNCSPPERVSEACAIIASYAPLTGAYANGFVSVEAMRQGAKVDGLEARKDLDAANYAQFAQDWHDKGARIIGGCCEVGPAHIAAVAEALARRG